VDRLLDHIWTESLSSQLYHLHILSMNLGCLERAVATSMGRNFEKS